MSSSNSSNESPVIVVGAGPTGMTAALALHARGVPVTILEADPVNRDRSGSRAIYVHGSTLRTLERIHPRLGSNLVDEGMVWPTRRTCWRGKEVFLRTYNSPDDSETPHFTSVPQVRTEAYMHEALTDCGIDIHWESEVETVDSGPEGVRMETTDGQEWRSSYVVGADGGGSTVRNEIGASFDGDQSANSFIVADVEAVEGWLSDRTPVPLRPP